MIPNPFKSQINQKILSFFLLLFVFSTSKVLAQESKSVKGTLQDSTGLSIISATIKLISSNDTLYSASDAEGNFTFNSVKSNQFKLEINSLGYENINKEFQFRSNQNTLDLGKIVMATGSHVLKEVNIEGSPLIVVKEDTLEYRAKDYNLKENAITEDLLKKLDGVEVDKDGNVKAQGEAITRVRINGKDFFGGDVKTATKNLPAEVIERIQIIDDYGDQANLTGNRSGDPERILNIQISPDRNKGDFGTFRVGGGSEERYQGTASYNSFTESRQFSALGNLNNVNAPLFDFQTRGGGARRNRGGGGFGGGFGGGGRNGLTNVGSIGINYRKTLFDEKLTTYGNYSYGHSDNNTLSNALNKYDYQDTVITDSQLSNQNTIGNNHRFDWNFEYKPNDRDYFKLSPTFSINNNEAASNNNGNISTNGILDNIVTKQNTSNSKSPDVGISGLYNRRLNDKGRNLFVDFSINNSKTEQDRDEIVSSLSYVSSQEDPDSLYQRQLIDLNNKRLNGGFSISYTEPLSDKSGLEFNYNYNFANYDNSRIAFDSQIDGTTTPNLDNSNVYDYTFNTNRFSLTYRYRGEKMNYSLGASAQPSLLKGTIETGGNNMVIKRNAVNYAPVARFEYKFSRTQGLNINYNGRSSEPSFSQLQPIRDISNPQFPVTGNPNLDAEFIHSIRIRYNNFNTQTGTTFFAFLDGSKTDNKIVSNRVSLPSELYGRVQETTFLNTDGFYSTRGFYNLSRAFNKRKYVISANGAANFTNNVSFVDSEENVAKNWILSQGFNFQVNLSDWLEVMPGINYTFNTTKNTISSRPTQNVSTWAMNLNSKVYIIPTLLWGVELSKMSNNGYSSNIAANPLIINTYIEKEFFKGKQGAVRLHAFDLLDEQVNVSRTVTENSILDNRSNRLSRYFMLSLTYKFQKFAGVNASPDSGHEWRGGGNRPRF
jgi:hypothetical protein